MLVKGDVLVNLTHTNEVYCTAVRQSYDYHNARQATLGLIKQ